MDRFRSNIVLQGEDWAVFEEDVTVTVNFGHVRVALVKPCTRCSIPDVDQLSALPRQEPGLTLTAYRNLEIGVEVGQNGIVDVQSGATLRVGDSVEAELDFLGTQPAGELQANLRVPPNSTMPATKVPMMPIPTQAA